MICCCSLAGTKACEHCVNNGMPINDFSFEYLGVLPGEHKPDWYTLNQCKDCPAVDGCAGMNGECPYSKER